MIGPLRAWRRRNAKSSPRPLPVTARHVSDPAVLGAHAVRVWNMLAIWREIGMPKLDLTSFGYWSGTGLVDWIDAEPLR